GTDGHHAVATGRTVLGGVVGLVACGHDHGGAPRDCAVDRILVGPVAAAAAAEAHVDDLGRVGLGGDARHRAAGGPGDGVGDIGKVATALAEHAHRQHLGLVRDTGHADAVVGLLGHGAGHVGTVPGAVLRDGAGVALVVVLDPVTIVLRAW